MAARDPGPGRASWRARRRDFLRCTIAVHCLACGQSAREAPLDAANGAAAACQRYRDQGQAWGYCLTRAVLEAPGISLAESTCAQAGAWQGECRLRWAAARAPVGSGVETEALLAFCGEYQDCAFAVLDARPSPEVSEQLTRCERHAPRYARDCAEHALQRWYAQEPSAQEVRRLAARNTAYWEQVGVFVSASVACRGVGSCDGTPAVQEFCLRSVAFLRAEPQSCPAPIAADPASASGRPAPATSDVPSPR